MRDSVKSIQFLRFIAAALVVFSHAMDNAKYQIADSTSPLIHYVADFGRSGVHIFFVISGFIMIYASFGEGREFDSSEFLLRRFIRIFPIYWVYAAAYILMRQIVSRGYNSIWDVFGSLLLLPNYSWVIIAPGWTLSYEIYFYICFAIFMILGLTRGLLAMTFFFMISIAAGLVVQFGNTGLQLATNSLLIEFLFGAWIAYVFVSGAHLSLTLANTLVVLGVALFMIGIALGYNRLPTVLTWGVPSALLIAGSVFKERGGGLSGFVQRYSYLGNSSYSLYLLHVLLIGLMLRGYLAIFPRPMSGYLLICLVLSTLCVPISVVLYEYVERWLVGYWQSMVTSKDSRVRVGPYA
jgi:exopolysaccharide production protein ExoZ